VFGKRIGELTAGDIDRLWQDVVPEGAEVELKETLPTNKGRVDPWFNGGDSIGEKARNELLEEVIAFANAFGGSLVLGISETDDKPARAKAIVPLPRCAELADRLRLQCRDCIEPQIPLLEVAGVPTRPDGAGVVVFQVPRSRAGPHRHTVTKECYVRRADRTERMTMREIQDLTLHLTRSAAGINAIFDSRRLKFQSEFGDYQPYGGLFGVRVTAIPLVPVFFEHVHREASVAPVLTNLTGVLSDGGIMLAIPPQNFMQRRPILRGSQGHGGSFSLDVAGEVYSDGLIEYRLFEKGIRGAKDDKEMQLRRDQPPPLYASWFMCLAANVLCSIERFRRRADAPSVEWALEVEIQNANELRVGPYPNDLVGRFSGQLPAGGTLFPQYSVGGPEEFPDLHAMVERDFWHAAGNDVYETPVIDYARALKVLGAG
jgi:hypothetical protein